MCKWTDHCCTPYPAHKGLNHRQGPSRLERCHYRLPVQGKGSKSNWASYRLISLLLYQAKCSLTLSSGITTTVTSTTAPTAILALRLLSELYRRFPKPLHVAYVDIKAAFDSVDQEALSKALQAKHVPLFRICLIKDLHTGAKSCVRVGRSCTAPFPTSSGVRQGCVLAPALFCIASDWIMSMCADKAGVNVERSLFTDYADGAVLFAVDDT